MRGVSAIPAFQSRHSSEGGNPEGCGGRLRAIVRIRIFRIGGIFRISIRAACPFRHNRDSAKTNGDERRQNPENPDSDNGGGCPLDSRFRGNDGGRRRE